MNAKTLLVKQSVYIILFIPVLILTSCFTPKPTVETTVKNLVPGASLAGRTVLFALPRTSLVVRVQAVKTTYVPGPFRKYSGKYLGIQPEVNQKQTVWRLKEAGISSFTEPDPANYFTLTTNGVLVENALTLTGKGLILDVTREIGQETPAFTVTSDEPDGKPYFTDLSVKRNFIEKADTVYRTVMRDTGFVRIPVVKTIESPKTLDEKAEEAANFIIKIRKRRFKLMSGQYDTYPRDEALEFAVKEMTRLENEYLALFLGKKVDQTWYYRFLFTPTDPAKQQVLFRFSRESGICQNGGCKGIPVYFTWTTADNTPDIPSGTVSVADSNRIYYRIPELTDVRLNYNDRILAQKHLFIYQFGPVIELAPNVILDKAGK